jgi:dipeptidyl aminopeptidase/acylaminoacyl peptidase
MAEDLLLGGLVEDLSGLARLASPITHVSVDVPPFLIMHGSDDPVVPVEQSLVFDEALRSAGVDVTLLIIEGAGHGFPRKEFAHVKPFFDRFLLPSPDSG